MFWWENKYLYVLDIVIAFYLNNYSSEVGRLNTLMQSTRIHIMSLIDRKKLFKSIKANSIIGFAFSN